MAQNAPKLVPNPLTVRAEGIKHMRKVRKKNKHIFYKEKNTMHHMQLSS